MGMSYCLVFDDDNAEHAFDAFEFFPLIIDELDEISRSRGASPLGQFLHHDPDSNPEQLFSLTDGMDAIESLIGGLRESGKKKFGSFKTQEIAEELDALRNALNANLGTSLRFTVALLY